MRKFLAFVICLCLLTSFALAEDYSTLTKEELEAKRQELIQELNSVTSAYGALAKTEILSSPSEESLGSIQSLFPDENFAMCIRDELNKFSISQPVTQAELDTITTLQSGGFSNYQAADLTGIHFLRYLKEIDLSWQQTCSVIPDEIGDLIYLNELDINYSSISTLPEGLGNCINLTKINADVSDIRTLPKSFSNLINLKKLDLSANSSFIALPDDIGSMINLTELNVNKTSINSLPDSICECINLTTLNISNTNVSSLPENIGNLVNLSSLNISNTKISSLPESIWGLSLKSLDMSGTSIK